MWIVVARDAQVLQLEVQFRLGCNRINWGQDTRPMLNCHLSTCLLIHVFNPRALPDPCGLNLAEPWNMNILFSSVRILRAACPNDRKLNPGAKSPTPEEFSPTLHICLLRWRISLLRCTFLFCTAQFPPIRWRFFLLSCTFLSYTAHFSSSMHISLLRQSNFSSPLRFLFSGGELRSYAGEFLPHASQVPPALQDLSCKQRISQYRRNI